MFSISSFGIVVSGSARCLKSITASTSFWSSEPASRQEHGQPTDSDTIGGRCHALARILAEPPAFL